MIRSTSFPFTDPELDTPEARVLRARSRALVAEAVERLRPAMAAVHQQARDAARDHALGLIGAIHDPVARACALAARGWLEADLEEVGVKPLIVLPIAGVAG